MEQDNQKRWHEFVAQWTQKYRNEVSTYKVKPNISFGEVMNQIENEPPQTSQSMENIFNDFEDIIVQNMTHWQHPRFFAYFQSNAAFPSVIAEQLAAAISAQCMLWQTSPAATELEIKMIEWIKQAFDLPQALHGCFQDTASTATLCAILSMREKALEFSGNKQGLFGQKRIRIYCSEFVHSSIDKACWVAGIGQDNLIKIPSNSENYSMSLKELNSQIDSDIEQGFLPAGLVLCAGGTSFGAFDQIKPLCKSAQQRGLFVHVDAAWAGSILICEEYRKLFEGIQMADSIVINLHKWLGISFECSAHFFKDKNLLKQTLSIQPKYLETIQNQEIHNLSDYSIQLGRRFRALKVWFLFRYYGLEQLKKRLRHHVAWVKSLAQRLRDEDDFEIMTDPILSLFTFRYHPKNIDEQAKLNELNQDLIERINQDGRIYLTQTELNKNFIIRFVAGQFDMQENDINIAFETIVSLARE